MDAAEPAEDPKIWEAISSTRSFDGTSFVSNSAYIWGWEKCPPCPLGSTGSKYDANLKTAIFDNIDKPMQCDVL